MSEAGVALALEPRVLRYKNRKLWRPTGAKNHVRTVSSLILFRHVEGTDVALRPLGKNVKCRVDDDGVVVDPQTIATETWSGEPGASSSSLARHPRTSPSSQHALAKYLCGGCAARAALCRDLGETVSQRIEREEDLCRELLNVCQATDASGGPRARGRGAPLEPL